MSMANGSMSYDVHKVTPVHGTMDNKLFVTLQKGQENIKVKTTGLRTILVFGGQKPFFPHF